MTDHVPGMDAQVERGEDQSLFQEQVGRWRRLFGLTFLALVVCLGSQAFTALRLIDIGHKQVVSADNRDDDISRLTDIAVDVKKATERLDSNQAGIDVLVSYVEELKANAGGDNGQKFVDLLCASSDPVRIKACQELGALP
jgi:hypothetical protein